MRNLEKQEGQGDKSGKSGVGQRYRFAVKASLDGMPVLLTVEFADSLRSGGWRETLAFEVYEPAPRRQGRPASVGR